MSAAAKPNEAAPGPATITLNDFDSLLDQVAHPQLLEEGCVNIVSIAPVRDKLGERWGRSRDNIYRHIEKQLGRQKADNYFELLLPEETSRYVFRMLAMKAILSDPERYGFHLRPKDLYPPYLTDTVQVMGPVEDLNDFATRRGTNYKTLKLLNPWLRDNVLDNTKGKPYIILLPAKGFESATADND